MRLNGTRPVMFCRWGMIPSMMSRMTAALMRLVCTPVGVGLGLTQVEVVYVPVEGVLLVQREQPVLECSLYGGLPGLDQEVHLLFLVQLRLAGRLASSFGWVSAAAAASMSRSRDAFASSAPAFR